MKQVAMRKGSSGMTIGCIPNTGDSVEEVRAIRRQMERDGVTIEEINRSGEKILDELRRRGVSVRVVKAADLV